MAVESPLVSLVIPCFNQAHYLHEAIESALDQSHPRIEVIVVDDGSEDEVETVVARYPFVRLVRRNRGGVSRARNHGFEVSRGDHVVFLDADDRLVRDSARIGVDLLEAAPSCSCAAGLCRVIGSDGRPRPFRQEEHTGADPYLALLSSNFIWMPGQVIFRRAAFAEAGGFSSDFDACADYDLYLRLARTTRICVHREVVAEYRQHGENMSANAELMLVSALAVLDRQWVHVAGNREREIAFRQGQRFWRAFYGDRLVDEIRSDIRGSAPHRPLARKVFTLLRYNPAAVGYHLWRKLSNTLRKRVVSGPLPSDQSLSEGRRR